MFVKHTSILFQVYFKDSIHRFIVAASCSSASAVCLSACALCHEAYPLINFSSASTRTMASVQCQAVCQFQAGSFASHPIAVELGMYPERSTTIERLIGGGNGIDNERERSIQAASSDSLPISTTKNRTLNPDETSERIPAITSNFTRSFTLPHNSNARSRCCNSTNKKGFRVGSGSAFTSSCNAPSEENSFAIVRCFSFLETLHPHDVHHETHCAPLSTADLLHAYRSVLS